MVILNQHQIPIYPNANISFFIPMIIVSIMLICLAHACNKKRYDTLYLMFALLSIATIFFTIFYPIKTPSYYIEYTAYISENDSFDNYNNKYELISQDGLLYTFRDKITENEDNK